MSNQFTPKSKYGGIALIFFSAVLFSLGGVFIKYCTWNPITINGTRCFFAGLVMLIFALATGHKIKFNKSIFIGALANCLTNLTFVCATKMTTAGNAVVLHFTMPIFVIIFGFLFFHRKPKKSEVMTCIVVFLGIICFFVDQLSITSTWGNLIGLASGMCYSLVFLQNEFKGGDFESANIFGHLLSSLIGIPFLMMETNYSLVNFGIVAFLGVIALGTGTVLLAVGLRTVSPITGAIVSTIEPILNPIFVAIFYHEQMSVFSIIGAIIVICSVVVYNIFIRREDKGKNTS